jgi:hypothetical protein
MRDAHTTADARIRINDCNLINRNSFHGAQISTVPASNTIVFIDVWHKGRRNHCFGVELMEADEKRAAIIATVTNEAVDID